MVNFDCGIYTITSPSGKQYVGSTVSFRKRWRTHLQLLRLGTHHCRGLQRAYKKYGEQALVFAKIAFVPKEDLVAREQEQIDSRLRSRLYNTSPTAGSTLGVRPSDETRKKMADIGRRREAESGFLARISAAKKGTKRSPEICEKISAGQRGKEIPPEARAKLSAAMTGRKLSDEHRRNISEGLLGGKRNDDTRAKMSIAQRGRTFSDDAKAKMSAAKKGKKLSEDHRRRLSEAQKARQARGAAQRLNPQEPT